MKKENPTPTKHDVFELALRLLDAGIPERSIIASHPDHDDELKALFESIHALESARSVKPSPELLRSALSKMESPVPSPFGWFSSARSKHAASFLAVVFLIIGGSSIAGGVFLNMGRTSGATPRAVVADSASDSALNQDAQSIDVQIGELGTDESQTDQALQQASSDAQ